jgi:hypothetical protein
VVQEETQKMLAWRRALRSAGYRQGLRQLLPKQPRQRELQSRKLLVQQVQQLAQQ